MVEWHQLCGVTQLALAYAGMRHWSCSAEPTLLGPLTFWEQHSVAAKHSHRASQLLRSAWAGNLQRGRRGGQALRGRGDVQPCPTPATRDRTAGRPDQAGGRGAGSVARWHSLLRVIGDGDASGGHKHEAPGGKHKALCQVGHCRGHVGSRAGGVEAQQVLRQAGQQDTGTASYPS